MSQQVSKPGITTGHPRPTPGITTGHKLQEPPKRVTERTYTESKPPQLGGVEKWERPADWPEPSAKVAETRGILRRLINRKQRLAAVQLQADQATGNTMQPTGWNRGQ